MTRIIAAALLATGMTAGTAAADAVVVYNAELGDEFAAKDAIVELAKEAYGPTSVYDNGQQLPEGVVDTLVPGQKFPEGVAKEPVPEALRGKLPQTEPATEWVKAGEHLIEIKRDGEIATAVFDVLPAS